jgi:myo-inositol catabolism protein IolS
MQLNRLGSTDIEITRIIMGTWQAGKTYWVNIDDRDTTKAIRGAIDKGINTIDTAEAYGDGHSERIVSRALEGVARDKVRFLTKVFVDHMKYDQVIEACNRSLKNLRTDYIDLYMIHWPSGTFGTEIVPIEETMSALVHLKESGKIRAIGVSNFSTKQIEEILSYGRIDAVQSPYSLFWRGIERELLPLCEKKCISVLAYSPMAQGLLTGRFGPDHHFEEGDLRGKSKLFEKQTYGRVQIALQKLRPIADELGISLGQLALAWVTSHKNVSAIAGARDYKQSVENVNAGEIEIGTEALHKVDAIGRMVTDEMEDTGPILWNL